MEDIRKRLLQSINNYYTKNDNATNEGLADYLLKNVEELSMSHVYEALHGTEEEHLDVAHFLSRPIGSKVQIRSDLIPGKNYGGTGFMEEMVPYLGKETTITGYEYEEDCSPAYLLDIDDSFWSWNEEMLEKI